MFEQWNVMMPVMLWQDGSVWVLWIRGGDRETKPKTIAVKKPTVAATEIAQALIGARSQLTKPAEAQAAF